MSTMKHYVPGYVGAKVVMILAGLGILALGLAELARPAAAVRGGGVTVGEVVRVQRTAPGEPEQVHTTPGAIEADANPRAIFRHYVEYQSEDGANHVAQLTSASSGRPVYTVGEQLRIAPDPSDADLAWPVYDLRTWVFGAVLAGLGLFTIFIFAILLRHARRPIPMPEDTPSSE